MQLPETDQLCEGSYCVPRDAMPQVDEKDLGQLLGHFISRGIRFAGTLLNPLDIHSHQRVDVGHLRRVNTEPLLRKPILVSEDMRIIDGNHRRMAHLVRGTQCPSLLIALRFEKAVDAIFECPCAYSYGDGRDRPWSY